MPDHISPYFNFQCHSLIAMKSFLQCRPSWTFLLIVDHLEDAEGTEVLTSLIKKFSPCTTRFVVFADVKKKFTLELFTSFDQFQYQNKKVNMANSYKELMIPDELVMNKIYLIRGQKVMLDRDLAELYDVETKVLNQAVKRNADRFPADFMFQLTKKEFENLKSQIVTSSWGGVRKMPFAFTEQGVAMLSSVLKSEIAIRVNIQIIRIFTRMREMIMTHKDILLQLEKIDLPAGRQEKNSRGMMKILLSYFNT